MKERYTPPREGTFILYGADISLNSGKLRSYLKKKGIPFQEKPATYRCYKHFVIPIMLWLSANTCPSVISCLTHSDKLN